MRQLDTMPVPPRLAVLVMPSPTTLRAPAVWVTARNWARGLEERFGEVRVCLPGNTSDDAASLGEYTRPTTFLRQQVRPQPALQTVRTLAKDVLTLRARRRDTLAYCFPTGRTPALVWQHHDLLLDAGTRLAERTGVPLVQFVDAPQVWEARRWGVTRRGWGKVLERVAEIPQLRAADAVACVSAQVADAVADLGVPRERIVVTPCTADPSRFHPGVDGERVRSGFGFTADDVVFGWIGSFRRFHGLHDLVRAFARVAEELPTARLLLIGDGADRPAVQQHLEELQVLGRATLADPVPHDDIPECIAAMDVALVTAAPGGNFHYSPLKLREYLSTGRPVVSARTGQMETDFEDGKHLEMYDVGDVNSLTVAMLRLGADPTRRQRIGRVGHEKEVTENGIRTQIERVLAVTHGFRSDRP